METKGLTCKIPLELHSRITDEIQRTESTLGKFIEKIILEHYEREERNQMDKGRTLAFSISEELFQQIKGLIQQALEEADEEFEAARAGQKAEETAREDDGEEMEADVSENTCE